MGHPESNNRNGTPTPAATTTRPDPTPLPPLELTEDLMPQAMPTAPNIPERPQEPGAYRGSNGVELERTSSLYKGGLLVLGRPSPDSLRLGVAQEDDAVRDPIITAAVHAAPSSGEIPPNENPKGIGGPSRRDLHQKKIGIAVLLILIATIVAVVVGVVVGQKHSSSGGGAPGAVTQDTPVQLEQVFENPTQDLPPTTIAQIRSGDPNNPQQRAFQWLAEDPNLWHYSIPQKRQRLALAALYFATNGPNWFDSNNETTTAWIDYTLHECQWYSLASHHAQQPCSNYTVLDDNNPWNQHADYTSLVLSGDQNYIEGTNQVKPTLYGYLVPELGLLTKLQILDVGHQNLKGTIPTELSELSSSLRHVVLEAASFTGTIPQALFEFARVLRLNRNGRLDQDIIPTTVGKNTELTHLALVETNRQGSIPTELFRATRLVQLLLNDNAMTGVLPAEIGLVASSLEEINLNVNRFTGSIPTEVGMLVRLVEFNAGGNRLSGLVPTEIGRLGETLHTINLKKNQLTGSLPSEIGGLTKLNYLDLSMNNWIGGLPTSLARLSDLKFLDIQSSGLEGQLRPELLVIGNETILPSWPRLEQLILSQNRMTGTIPPEIGMLLSLIELSLRGNDFESTLPSELSSLTALTTIRVEDTSLSGSVPEEVCALPLKPTLSLDCSRMECPQSCQCDCS